MNLKADSSATIGPTGVATKAQTAQSRPVRDFCPFRNVGSSLLPSRWRAVGDSVTAVGSWWISWRFFRLEVCVGGQINWRGVMVDYRTAWMLGRFRFIHVFLRVTDHNRYNKGLDPNATRTR